jgi:hypothetical protein
MIGKLTAFPPPLRGRVREGGGHESLRPCGPPTPPRKGEGSSYTVDF